MTATITRAERVEHDAKLRQKMAERNPLWNPRARELYSIHEIEIENIDYLLPEGIDVQEAVGTNIMEGRPATEEECRQFVLQFADIEFDIEGDIATQVADHLVRLANELLESAKRIREEDLTYDWEEDEDEEDSQAETDAA